MFFDWGNYLGIKIKMYKWVAFAVKLIEVWSCKLHTAVIVWIWIDLRERALS
jgi:hypothetical protein